MNERTNEAKSYTLVVTAVRTNRAHRTSPRRAARMNSRMFGRADGDGFQPAICIIPLPGDCLIPSRSRECDSRNLLRSPTPNEFRPPADRD